MAVSGIVLSAKAKEMLDLMKEEKTKNKNKPGCLFQIVPIPGGKIKNSNHIDVVEGSFTQNIVKNGLAYYRDKYFLKEDVCYYLLYYTLIGSGDRKPNETPVLVNWAPDSASVRQKMLASSSFDQMKAAVGKANINGVSFIGFSGLGEVTLHGLTQLKCVSPGQGGLVLDGVKLKKVKTEFVAASDEELSEEEGKKEKGCSK